MNKFLKILWIVILVGSAFIAFHFLRVPTGQPPLSHKDPHTIIKEVPLSFDINDKSYSQLLNAGDKNFSLGNYEDAIKNYAQATSLEPKNYDILIKLGKAYLKNNQPPQAKLSFEKAIELKSDSVEAVLALAQANLNLGDINKAKEIIWTLDEENPHVKYYRGIIFVLAKDFDKAWALFSQVGDENSKKFLESFELFSHFREPDPLYLNMMLAKNLTDVGQFKVSIPFLFDILNQKNNYRDAWIVLGYAYLNIGNPKEAVDALMQAKIFAPQHPQVLFYLGLSYFAQNEINNAINYIEAADRAGYTPKDQLKLRLADLYLLKNNHQRASDNYKAVLNLNSDNLEVFVRVVWLNIDKLNNPNEAVKFAEKALEEHPDSAMSYNLAGWAYASAENYDLAEQYLRKALELKEDFDAVYLNMGWMYEKKGNYEMAKEYYKQAYILGQGNSIGNRAAMRFNELTVLIESLKSTNPNYYD